MIEASAQVHPELPAWIAVAVETGMRRGELAALRREWITGRVIRLPDTKNGTARSVPLSARDEQSHGCYVVTAYRPDPDCWSGDYKTRRQP